MDTSKNSHEITITEITKEIRPDEGYQKTCKKLEEILPKLPKTEGWWFDHLVQYHGFWLGPKEAAGALLAHDHFNPRPSDIILSTYPKSGTTWLRALIFATINRNSYDFFNHPLLKANPQDLVAFLEAVYNVKHEFGSYSHVDELPPPRFISTHLPYSLLPESMTKTSSSSSPVSSACCCRFVYICRDPKDVFVSKWHFMNKLRPQMELPQVSIEKAFDLFCKGISHYGPFWDHVLGYWKASLESPNNVLFLKYEDVKKEPLVCVRKLAEFLGLPFTEEEERNGVVQEIVKLCSFENLSNLEVNKTLEDDGKSIRLVSNPHFFRKGEVGDWVNHLTPEMVERLDQITKEKFQGSGFNFD